MIRVTRLGRQGALVLNAELIKRVEAVPDTTITLTDGEVLVVSESVEEIVQLVIAYRRQLFAPAARSGGRRGGGANHV